MTTIGKRIFPESKISDDQTYLVIGTPKDGDGGQRIAFTGSFDHCQEYADRNDSEDNYERYAVHEQVKPVRLGRSAPGRQIR